MTSQNDLDKRALSIVDQALDTDPREREIFLRQACDSPELRARVDKLLGEIEASPAPEPPPIHAGVRGALMPDPYLGRQIGPYRIVTCLGEGGMGVVYLAEQEEPIHRKVALKIIKLGMDTASVIARFEAEREALALMNHPNVAKILDAGATQEGRPYFVMEYVEGVPVTQYCDDARTTIEARLKLFVQICHAVQHAHQKGIIHRDLKPNNVLVVEVDGVPTVKVIDFGIAKATQQNLTEYTFSTEQGVLIGTPSYMSPEQADVNSRDIDTRTDVYSLGVILYELLTGALPFDPDTLRQAALSEIQRIIREVDPPKPSSRVGSVSRAPVGSAVRTFPRHVSVSEPRASASGSSATDANKEPLPHGRGSDSPAAYEPQAPARGSSTAAAPLKPHRHDPDSVDMIASRRGTDPKSLHRHIRGDLDWIVMKCLEKERSRRYDTANALAMEIHRYLNNEPVLAGPPSVAYRVRKFVRRNKGPVGAAVAVILLLVGGFMGTSVMFVRARAAEQRERTERVRAEEGEAFAEKARAAAEQARDESDTVTKFLSDMLASARPEEQGRDVSVRQVLDKAAQTVGEKLADKPLIEARLRGTIGVTYRALGLYDAAETHLTESVVIYTRELGPRDRRTLAAANDYAVVLGARGGVGQEEALLRGALEIQRRAQGGEHPDTLAIMNNLASNLSRQGRYVEAAELSRKTLEIQRRVLGEEHPRTLESMGTLTINLSRQGRYVEAEALFRKTLETSRRILGEEHPSTLDDMNNLASNLGNQGRYGEAEELFRKTLEISRRILGEEHPRTLLAMDHLASSLSGQGRYAEAEEFFHETLESSRRILGEEHPTTLDAMNNLANSLSGRGHYVEAEAYRRKTLEIRRRVLGDEHPSTLESMHNLANSLGNRGRYAEAEALVLSVESGLASHADAGQRRRENLEDLVKLYDFWDAAEPGKGYAEKAVEWRRVLSDFQVSSEPKDPTGSPTDSGDLPKTHPDGPSAGPQPGETTPP